jgi:Protein of unknown function (DUF1488)
MAAAAMKESSAWRQRGVKNPIDEGREGLRTFGEHSSGGSAMFFSFPPDGRWNGERQAVEFSVSIGGYEGTVRVGRRVFQTLLTESPTPERCVEAYHLHRTRFELIAERKLRRRHLNEDGDVEITGRDLRERQEQASFGSVRNR